MSRPVRTVLGIVGMVAVWLLALSIIGDQAGEVEAVILAVIVGGIGTWLLLRGKPKPGA